MASEDDDIPNGSVSSRARAAGGEEGLHSQISNPLTLVYAWLCIPEQKNIPTRPRGRGVAYHRYTAQAVHPLAEGALRRKEIDSSLRVWRVRLVRVGHSWKAPYGRARKARMISADMDKQSGLFHNAITIRDHSNVSYRIYGLFTHLARWHMVLLWPLGAWRDRSSF